VWLLLNLSCKNFRILQFVINWSITTNSINRLNSRFYRCFLIFHSLVKLVNFVFVSCKSKQFVFTLNNIFGYGIIVNNFCIIIMYKYRVWNYFWLNIYFPSSSICRRTITLSNPLILDLLSTARSWLYLYIFWIQ